MQFEQTNFGFQSRKNSSYVKTNKEGAKIFGLLFIPDNLRHPSPPESVKFLVTFFVATKYSPV